MRIHRTAVLVLVLVAAMSLVAGGCTASDDSPRRARVAEDVEDGLAEELEEQEEKTLERLEALEEAREAGTVGVIARVVRAPAPGWAGERILNTTGNDWEPAIATDPSRPFVYVLHNRYGGEPACANRCPDPAMILHVSKDGGKSWRPERYLCACKGIKGQYDPLIEVADDTGAVYTAWMNNFQINFSSSTDPGKTWSAPVWVHRDVKWGDKPNMAVSPDGQDVYVLFNGPTAGDVYAATSHDAGRTWATVQLTTSDRYHFDYGGEVLPDGRVVFSHISFLYTGPGGAPEGPIEITLFASDDGGATWTELLVDELEAGSECTSRSCYEDYYDSGPVLAADDDGDLVIVYNGAAEHLGPRTVYARSSIDGGRTWGAPVQVSETGVNSAFPAAVGAGDDGARVWFAAQIAGRWNVWYTTSDDLGATWADPVKLSDATSGTAYKNKKGFVEVYGDYGEIAITSSGATVAVWGEGASYYGPGGVWFNRQR
ncbi:MAG: sialidase family protein [Actinomycetota bacterium]